MATRMTAAGSAPQAKTPTGSRESQAGEESHARRTLLPPSSHPRARRLSSASSRDRLATTAGGWEERLGLRCHHYNDEDEMFKTAATNATDPYEWKHCVEMMVGEPRGRTPTPPFPKQHLK